MSCEEHYFENLLFYGEDCKTNCNKNALSPEVQQAIETCADYVLYTIFMTRENFLAYVREDNARPQGEWEYKEIENSTIIGYWCNQCHIGSQRNYNFCPYCGADMRSKKNETDN